MSFIDEYNLETSRADLVGHRKCWYKEAYRDQLNPNPPARASAIAEEWVDELVIDSVEEVEA